MMFVLHEMDTWWSYLIGCYFKIKTNHHSLKYFLEQCMSSLKQYKRVTKMLGYDYEKIYKKGKDNVVANALSCQYEDKGSMLVLLAPILDWLDESHKEWLQDPSIAQLMKRL